MEINFTSHINLLVVRVNAVICRFGQVRVKMTGRMCPCLSANPLVSAFDEKHEI
jgi:hypothetical protein